MEKIYDKNLDNLAKKSAEALDREIKALFGQKSQIVLAIPGGRSVVPLFKELKNLDLPWKKIHIFMVDERRVPLDSPDSNFKLAQENFIDQLVAKKLLPKENLHPYLEDKGIESYENELKKFAGSFDVVILGVGQDGHCAALYPNHPSIKDESKYFITLNDSPKPPAKRMSASKNLIARAKVCFVLFIGQSKKSAYADFLSGEIKLRDCPAKIAGLAQKTFVVTNLKF